MEIREFFNFLIVLSLIVEAVQKYFCFSCFNHLWLLCGCGIDQSFNCMVAHAVKSVFKVIEEFEYNVI